MDPSLALGFLCEDEEVSRCAYCLYDKYSSSNESEGLDGFCFGSQIIFRKAAINGVG